MKTKQKQSNHLIRMVVLLAMLLAGINVAWGQTKDFVFDTTQDTDGFSYNMDQGKMWYKKSITGIGEVTVEFPLQPRDETTKCISHKKNGEASVTAPNGYVVTYVKVEFYQAYNVSYNFAQYGEGGEVTKENVTYVDFSYPNTLLRQTARVANRNVGESSDVLIKSVTVRIHKTPTISISSDNPTRMVTLNEQVKMTPTVNGEIAVGNTGQPGIRWYLLNSADDTNCTGENFLGWHDSFTFTPNTGVKKNGTDDVLKSGYGTYYIGARAQQQCIGTGGWEDSDVKVYTITTGVKVSVNTSPANLTNDFTIHQNGHSDWVIHNGDIVAHKTTAVFTAPNVPGYTFDGWYEGSTKKSDQQSEYAYGNVNSDLTLTAKYTPITHPANLTCQNGNVDLSKVVAYGNTSFDGNTFTVNDYNQYGNGLRITFETPQNLSYAKSITINGSEIPFKNPLMKEGDETRWLSAVADGGKTVITLNNKNNANFDNIDFIELRDIQAGTYTISSIVVEFDHIPATPQLIDGTTATMVIPVGKTLKLSANNADNTFWREYTAVNGTQICSNTGEGKGHIPDNEYNTPVREISGLTQGTYYFAAERGRNCETGGHWHAAEKVWVTVDVEPQGTMPTELDRIKQPTYGTNHGGMAKEYIAIADLTASNGDHVKGWKDSEGNHITSVTGTAYHDTTDDKESTTTEDDKQKIAYVLGNHAYPVSQTDGLCISKWGRAGLVAGQTEIPTRATLIFKAAGTDDFFVLLKNYLPTVSGQPYGHDRRHIKVWYTNDQNVDASGNRKLMPFLCVTNNTTNDFYFYGERGESGLTPLQISVRLQHLGKNGTCDIYVTYEDDAADEMVWVKGIVVKRPDLSITIGRTDGYGCNEDGTIKAGYNNNVKITPFGKGNPYQWNFGTAGFYAKINPNGGNDASNETKKVNEYDGRTYICGEGPNGEVLMDHLLVFSDGQAGGDKAEFDGRKETNGKHTGYETDEKDNNEHIELKHPTNYGTGGSFKTNRREFIPLLSDGIKVNVTGSGWLTIACTAPNGDVKVKVLSSTNGGTSYINLLREFTVKQSEKEKKETDWQTYRVYLKAHQERGNKNGDVLLEGKGFWDGDILMEKYEENGQQKERIPNNNDPEQTPMSLYVVFEAKEGVDYKTKDSKDDAQLNIHYLQWVNELPADYVFQREENPALLNSLQSVVSSGTATKPALYWQAGTSKVEGKTTLTPTGGSEQERTYDSAFLSAEQILTANGQNSGSGSVSESLGCVWDIASVAQTVAHTEKAYWNEGSAYGQDDVNVYDYATAKTFNDPSVSNINREFASPISGSFFRFMPMKNQYIKTHVVTNGKYTDEQLKAAEGDTRTNMLKEMKIYIIDETGQPIPFHPGADAREGNKSALDADAREHGWVAYAQGLDYDPTGKFFYPTFNETTGVPAVRIDIAALAGKEYFLCSNGTKISLARLDASNNNYRIVDLEKTTLTLNNGGTANQSNINTAMSGTGRHIESATLTGRTFAAGQWASLVLPFSLNEKKLEEVFGEGTQCLHFTEMDKEKNTVYLTHHFYNMVVAGRPVFIKPGSSFTMPASGNITFNDVTLQANTVTTTQTTNGFTFFASYDNATINKGDLYMNDKNGINYLNIDNDTYPGMRSFIQSHGFVPCQAPSTQTQQTKAMFLNFDDTDAEFSTGIESLISAEFGENAIVVTKSTKVYDLNGRVVAAGADINNLPAGMYIVNGKKYVVK